MVRLVRLASAAVWACCTVGSMVAPAWLTGCAETSSPAGHSPTPSGRTSTPGATPQGGKQEEGERGELQLDRIDPSSVLAGSKEPSLVLRGSGFGQATYLELDSVPVPTSFVSDTELRVTLQDSDVASAGERQLSVANPGGDSSNSLGFTVANPVAQLTDVDPKGVLLNAGATTVTVTGTGFAPGAIVLLGDASLSTRVIDTTKATAIVPAVALAQSLTAELVVANPAPGGGPSLPLTFTVANPNVAIDSLSPARATAGSGTVALQVRGRGFVAASKVVFNATSLPTTFVSDSELRAQVPSSLLQATASYGVTVTSPPPGGGSSLPAAFSVENPAPAIASLSPASAPAGAAATQVTVTGSGFVSGSVVYFDGAPQTTQFLSATRLSATLSATRLASPRTIAVTVGNPAPGGGTSPRATFTVNNPPAVLSSVSPNEITVGSGPTTITLTGSGYVRDSVVQIDGANLPTDYVSPTQLTAVVPASRLGSVGTLFVNVENPDPGATSSLRRRIDVRAAQTSSCDSSGVDFALAAVGSPRTIDLGYTQGPAPRLRWAPSDPSSYTCNISGFATTEQHYSAFVVQNTSGASASLAAWLICDSDDDAYVLFYDNTGAVPTSLESRAQCTGTAAWGTSGGDKRTSPESGGSTACGGHTKANGGSIALAPCEKAVVWIQPFFSSESRRPTKAKIELQ